jgi:tetratricopeptide (TPR) repeat protein
LRARWSESESGRCRLAVVSGDAGIGKSRLVARFAAEVHGAGALVLHGGADAELLIPYQPFVEALSDGLEHAFLTPPPQSGQQLELAELGALVPALRRALPGLPPAQPAEPELRRYRLFEAVNDMLRCAASDRPVLLVLDDLQFADASTLGMLRYAVQRLDAVRLLVLATVRCGRRGPEGRLGRMVSEIRQDGLGSLLPLSGLSDDDVAQLVAGEASAWSDAWPGRLNRWTGGNPFFIEQLLGSLASEPASLESVVPESVRELVAWKLAELDALAARTLEVAAAIGDRCTLDLVEKVVGDDSDAVLDALEAAIAAELLREGDHVGTYVFSHSLARAAVYDSIGRTRRARMHLRIGEALAAGGAESAELAHHFWCAREVGGAGPAVDHLRAAGESADRAVAWEDARQYYERALEALELAAPREVERAAELMLALGDACERCGDSGEAKAVFGRLAELAREHRASTWLARAALGVGRAPGESMGTDMRLVALLREALAALPSDALQLRARVLARLAVELGTCAESDALSSEAVALAERAGDDVLLAIALASRRWVLWQPERLHERSIVSRRSLEAAIRAQDRERELAGRAWWLFDLLELGDMEGVESQLDAYLEIAESLRHPSYQGYGLAMRAMLALLRGQLAQAQDGVEAAFRMLCRAEDPDAPRVHALQRFLLERERGDLAASRRALEEHTSERPLWALLHGWAAAEAGDCDEALLALAAAPEIRRDAEWLAAMTARGYASAAVGSEQDVIRVRSALLPYADRIASVEGVACLGPVAHPLGLLAASRGDESEAVALLRDAVATAERIGAPGIAARAQADLGLLRSLDS